MTKPKRQLAILVGLLALQVPLWTFLILKVPVLSKKHSYSAFSVHAEPSRACMVLRISGSHAWGISVSDAFCIHLDSGRLSRLPIDEYQAMTELEQVASSRRTMRWTSDNKIEIVSHDPASVSGLDVQPTDFPVGKGPTLIGERYLLGIDETNVYMWDARRPAAGTQVFPTPLESRALFHPIADTSLAFCLLEARSTDTSSDTLSDSSSSSEAATSRPAAANKPAVANPFGVSDPFGGSGSLGISDPFGGPGSIGSPPARLLARPLLLFRVDERTGPQFVAEWDVLVPNSHSFSTDVVTHVDHSLVSLSPAADALEYRSIDTGKLIRRLPLPDGFDPRTMEWAFDHGRIHLGSWRWGPLFDLASGNWLPNPGKQWKLSREYRDDELAIYRSRVDERYVVFDHRRGKVLLDVGEGEGIPLLLDAETAAVCSTRCGFGVDVVDLRDGRTLASWTPWQWAKWLLFASLAAYAMWSFAWIKTAAKVHRYPWLDALIVSGTIVGVFALRCKWAGVCGIDETSMEQAIRGISCAVLTLSWCGLFAGRRSLLTRLVVFCFALGGVLAISRLLLDTAYEDVDSEGARVMVASYYDTVQALCYILISTLAGGLLCLVLLACGFRLRDVGKTSIDQEGQITWRIVDLGLLIASTAVLIAVTSPLAPHARYEAAELYGNNYYSEPWQMLVAIGPLTLALAVATLARRSVWFWLASLVAGMAVVAVGWEPIYEFVLHTSTHHSTPRPDHQRVAASSLAAAYVIAVPYRLRGWRISHLLTSRRDVRIQR